MKGTFIKGGERMQKEDVVVGKKYVMLKNEESMFVYIKKGAVVKVLDIQKEDELLKVFGDKLVIHVKDLSKDSFEGGIWWTSADKLGEIAE
jgi:hypothetical protein